MYMYIHLAHIGISQEVGNSHYVIGCYELHVKNIMEPWS